jgi:hypothetical protein
LQQKIVDEVGAHFDDLSQLLCRTSATVEADAGFRVLGSGVVFKVDAKLKEKNMFRLLEGYVVDSGDKKLRYQLSRDIVCKDSSPVRMSRLILEKRTPGGGDSVTSDQILLEDLKDTNSQWILSLQGKDAYTKMIAVDSWETYNAVRKKTGEDGGRGRRLSVKARCHRATDNAEFPHPADRHLPASQESIRGGSVNLRLEVSALDTRPQCCGVQRRPVFDLGHVQAAVE